jgi:hypothetical protein
LGKFWITLAASVLCALPVQAATLQIGFAGNFVGIYPGGAAYSTGTLYGGLITANTAAPANVVTSNAVGTFARFNSIGVFEFSTSTGDLLAGSVDALTNDLASGVDNFRFLLNLDNGYTFTLAYNFLPAYTVVGASLPNDPKIYSGQATGSVSNAQMRGNYGVAAATVRSAVVPEPATWAMFIAGFGIVGSAMRRRRLVAVDAI